MARFTEVERALDAWRAAERRSTALPEGATDRPAADAEVERLRSEYLALIDGPGTMPADPELSASDAAD